MAQKALSDATVRSPFDGVVTAKLKSIGEMATMMPPTVVVTVQDQLVVELRVRVPERWLTQVRPGSVLHVRFDAIGVDREAKVARINPTVDARTRTIEVIAELDNPDLQLKPGLLAQVDLPRAAAAAPPAPTTPPGAQANERGEK
jgi:multidrug efflux pump subunit AcrA (membrane-fusion protein)